MSTGETARAVIDRPYLWFLVAFHGLVPRTELPDFPSSTVARLEELGWTCTTAHEALAGLQRHTTAPLRLEEELVHDANLLEVIGAFGVAKAFTRGGAVGQTYEETLAIFERNLDAARFVTPAGRARAESGRRYAQAFIRQLRSELQSATLPTFGQAATEPAGPASEPQSSVQR